ncbi:MAG: hypothetical protein QNJ06_12085 [Kiloniellales bacterium]|nr:hypothetical protein [Kiloniellales bacterium]MDJ0970622.1 hypothetical protein [Kiloniellales bacterium]
MAVTSKPNPLTSRDISGRMSRWFAVLFVGLGLSACVQVPGTVRLDPSAQPMRGAKVLIMQPDVEVSELTVGGLLEPNAAWTAAAERNIDRALERVLAEQGANWVHLNPKGKLIRTPAVSQLVKLHGAVGASILFHGYPGGIPLLNKNGKFDWTLGQDAAILGRAYKADYALFVYFRDSFSSDARVALNVLTAIVGAGVRGGQQLGFASLVDLRTGKIVWFNIMARGTGDLREAEAAVDASQVLLAELPF